MAIQGGTLAGLNIVDLVELQKKLGVPVITIVRERPRESKIANAVRMSRKDVEEKLAILKKVGAESKVYRTNGLYVRPVGIRIEEVRPMLPNAIALIRLAHLIATGAARGE
ncbi:Uncharacterised protein [uncultured archaeon]|nr:Uncharacterised protein [uncultured archaeon]